MQYLKRIAFTVVLLLLLSFIKSYFDRSGAVYADFFRNLVANLQLLLLVTVTVISLVQFFSERITGRKRRVWRPLLVFLIVLAASEVLMDYLLKHSQSMPAGLIPACSEYYGNYGRNQIEFDPRCARYDPQLTYTLHRDSNFSFNNYEFRTTYSTNALGLRDDSNSLNKPEVICVGDSHTMGWGVNQQQTFSEVMAAKTGLNVLNAGISSYGTVREVLSLQRMDLSQLKYLFVQYCANDLTENQAFVEHDYVLPVMDNSKYDSLCQTLQWRQKYYPFRHVLTITRFGLQQQLTAWRNKKQANSDGSYSTQAELFCKVLGNATVNRSQVKVIVFDISGDVPMERRFLQSLNSSPGWAALRQNMNIEMIDIAPFMKKEFFFKLDKHMNARGHQQVAEILRKFIKPQ